VDDLEVENSVDRHDEVVRGDHRLRREADHLLAHVHLGPHGVQERDQQVEPGRQRAMVPAEPFDHVHPLLRDDAYRPEQGDQQEQDDERDDDDDYDFQRSHRYSFHTRAVAPLISMTRTRSPGSMTWVASYGRALHISPSTLIKPWSASTRSSTRPGEPSIAARPIGAWSEF